MDHSNQEPSPIQEYKICPKCGYKEIQEYKFCPDCGFDLTSNYSENDRNEDIPKVIELREIPAPIQEEEKGTPNIEEILAEMPPPFPDDTPEGKKAHFMSNLARDRLSIGEIDGAMQSMLSALKLGVPEPTYSRFKEYLLQNYNKKA